MVHADYMRIDPAYREALRACGLTHVEKVLGRFEGRVAAWSRTTDTLYVPGPPGEPGLYLKRYYYPSWRKRVRGTFRGTFFGLHRGQAEYRALQAMRCLGICAVRPVAYGERRVAHFVTACFLITEEVPGACNLTSFARDARSGHQPLSRAQRLDMIRRLARQVAEMHAAGFSHGQLFWRNILVRAAPDDSAEFFFLDAQPQPRWRRLGPGGNWWLRELAHLTVSATPFTTRTERLCFVRAYFGARRLSPQIREHVRQIGTLSERWRRHEARRIKMNNLFDEWSRQLERESLPAEQSAIVARQLSVPGSGTPR